MPDIIYEFDSGVSGIAFSGTDLGLFASGIYNDLMLASGSPFSVSYISGWLENHIGELNIACQTDFNTVSGFCVPPMDFTEISIYQNQFTIYYYQRSANNLLGASQYDWITLAEADSRIVKVSRNELAKTYRNSALDAQNELKYQIAQYRMTKGQPSSVTGDDTIFAPFTDRYNFGGYINNPFPYFGLYFIRSSSL